MNIIQFILISSLALLFLFYFSIWRKRVLDKIIIVGIVMLGIVFIIKPNWLTKVANLIGIGRGADLLIYLSIIFFSFVIVVLFAKIRKIEKTQTRIIRGNALKNGRKLSQHK